MFKGFFDFLFRHLRQLHFDLKTSKHTFSWMLILSMLAAAVAGVQYTQLGLQASILTLEAPKDFDGTVYPLTSSPKWHTLTTAEYKDSFDNIPSEKMQPMPRYNPNTLQASLTGLGYTDEENAVRDAKITYSVAYLGNYELDGVEYAGSHPAVDIKAPSGTPVRSIANGIVTKVADEAYGFGLHTVVKHVNVPTASGAGETLYSSYSHLSEILVKEGQLVSKGDIIGKVGSTGASTTPHLHFQIDKNEAPWHPYWPFTYNDYASKGITFFDAINQGIGQENAVKYTANPMNFVQSHLVQDGTIVTSSAGAAEIITAPLDLNEEEAEDILEPGMEIETEVVNEQPVEVLEKFLLAPPNYSLEISGGDTYLVGNVIEFELTVKDEAGNTVEAPLFEGAILLASTDSSIIDLQTKTIDKDSFANGKALIKAQAENSGEFKLRVPFSDGVYESNLVTISEDVKEIYGFKIEHDGFFSVGESETLVIVPVDENGNRTAYTILGQVDVSISEGNGILSKTVLGMEDFAEGQAQIEVTPQTDASIVVQVAHSFLKGVSEPILSGAPLFSDLSIDHENYEAIRNLKSRKVISGYPDGTFKPSKGVSRVEALKLIFAGLAADVPDAGSVKFTLSDLSASEWYAPFVAYAIDKKVVAGYPDRTFKPAQTVNKAEFAKMLVLSLEVDINLTVAPDSPIIGSDVKPSDWFYPYVEYLVDNEIIDLIDNQFNPAEPMDRAKVAEAIWRVVK